MNIENATKVVKFGDQYFSSLKSKPISESVKSTENLHVAGQMDEIHSAKYEGCSAIYYRIGPEKRILLQSLEITTNKVQLPFGIHVGAPKSSILKALGKPSSDKDGLLIYECGDPYSETVCFTVSSGVVKAINWENEID
ncbi:MAG: hypothetical protein IPQ13_04325 [Holophagaceae bacterium]|nr:hypothetical protein [Holophagaceae bacterium]